MIKSMTGFGRGETCTETIKTNIEMKSVNHRYCEIVLRMPRSLNVLEDRLRRIIQNIIARGRVEVFIKIELCGENRAQVKVDGGLADSYVRAVGDLKERLQLPGEVTAAKLLQLPGVFTLEEPNEDVEQWWPTVEKTLQQALEGLADMRDREGRQLALDIAERTERIASFVGEIEARSPVTVEEHRERLHQRVRDLMDKDMPDPARLDAEVVLFAERSSIAEEIVRLKSHLQQIKECLQNKDPVGRKMDFLLQEMNREINTIASKSADLAISRMVVEVKSELEKIREQIQNVE